MIPSATELVVVDGDNFSEAVGPGDGTNELVARHINQQIHIRGYLRKRAVAKAIVGDGHLYKVRVANKGLRVEERAQEVVFEVDPRTSRSDDGWDGSSEAISRQIKRANRHFKVGELAFEAIVEDAQGPKFAQVDHAWRQSAFQCISAELQNLHLRKVTERRWESSSDGSSLNTQVVELFQVAKRARKCTSERCRVMDS